MKRVFHSEKWLLVGNVILLVVAVVAGYAASQVSERVQEVRLNVSDAARQLEQMEARLAQELPPPDLVEMSRAVPSAWGLPYVFADVTLAMERHHLQVHSFTVGEPVQSDISAEETAEAADASMEVRYGPEPPKALSGVHALPLALEVKGNIDGVLAFLDELHRWPRLVWVTDFELLAEEPDEAPDLRIGLNVYAGAPWEAAETVETWPFDIPPANNGEAFGTHERQLEKPS